MPIVPIENLGLGGLSTDLPKESLGMEYFDVGLNMRPYEGSLRGVPLWDEDVSTIRLFQNMTDGPEYPVDLVSIRPIEITQWTAAGVDQIDVLTLGLDNTDGGVIYITGGGEDPSVVSELNSFYSFEYDQKFGWQAFIFNEVAIINTTTAPPMYSFDRENTYMLPNFFGEAIGSALTAVSQYTVYVVETVVDADWSSIGGSTAMGVGRVFTATSASADITALGSVKAVRAYTAKKMTVYNGRLIALNLENDLNDGDPANDIRSPIEIAYSSSVSNIATIIDLEWYASFRNTAGNLFLTATPGRIVDAEQLGEFLMVYKTDAVMRLQDTGEPLFVVGDTAFLDDGILSEGCVVDIGSNRHFCVGQYGIYLHSGGPEKEIVSNEKVEKFFYGDLPVSINDRNLTFVFHDSLEKEVWVCYRHRAAATDDTYRGCTRALIYNYAKGTWYLRTLPNLTKIIETEVEGEVRIFGASVDVVPNSSLIGTLYELSNTDLEPDGYIQFTTRSLGMVDAVKSLDGIYPTSSGSFGMRIATTDTPTTPDMSAVTPKIFDPSSNYKTDFRKTGRYYTIRFQMDADIEPDISAVKADIRQEGVR